VSRDLDPATLPEAPEPKLSPVRVLLALLLVAAIGAGGWFAFQETEETRLARADAAERGETWFAPYVDATLTPTVAFQDRSVNPARDVALGFIVAGTGADQSCTPTWGTFDTLDGAAERLDLDRRVTQHRGQGGSAIVSFGGQANKELALTCEKQADLEKAYRQVIRRYGADTVDFDIEGAALANAEANVRRAKAVKAVQDDIRSGGGRLAVWITLPVTPQGLLPDAIAVIRTMVAAKVDVAGVNIMAMDFGVPEAKKDMLGAVEDSMEATQSQLGALLGRDMTESERWGRLGVTVMIGQNDVDAERFTTAHAKELVRFAREKGLARLSTWSLNRDEQCGATFAVVGTHSDLCSGVVQKSGEFGDIFAGLRGTARSKSAVETPTTALPSAAGAVKDDPARSPYPIWLPEKAYREGYKVVWHQAVYVAKWYTIGTTPDAQNLDPGDAPWRLLGPVLSTDRPPSIPKLPKGTHPEWNEEKTYRAGAKVLHEGLPYRASWFTQGDVPGEGGPAGSPSPWVPLFKEPGAPDDDE
jgi:chitinase